MTSFLETEQTTHKPNAPLAGAAGAARAAGAAGLLWLALQDLPMGSLRTGSAILFLIPQHHAAVTQFSENSPRVSREPSSRLVPPCYHTPSECVQQHLHRQCTALCALIFTTRPWVPRPVPT